MLKKIITILKKIVLGFLFIYAYNSIVFSLNLNIPINIITVLFVTIFGLPALVGLCIISLFVF